MESDERAPLLLTWTIIQSSTQDALACATVIAANLFERLAYFSIAGNLVFFLTKEPLCWSITLATVTILVLMAIASCMGLLSGWLSDSYLGRYLTIVAGYSIYIFGYSVFLCVPYYSQNLATSENVTESYTLCNATRLKNETPLFCVENDTNPMVCAESEPANFLTMLYVGVILVGIGAGTVHTNLASFGGDQVSYVHLVY